jgi:hypothetical protein
MICTDDDNPCNVVVNTTGYSGFGLGRDNPDWNDVANVGPIPRGVWDIGTEEERGTGPMTLPLTPNEDYRDFNTINNTNRDPDTFLIHGDNASQNYTASEGCIILNPEARSTINSHGGGRLHVVP